MHLAEYLHYYVTDKWYFLKFDEPTTAIKAESIFQFIDTRASSG